MEPTKTTTYDIDVTVSSGKDGVQVLVNLTRQICEGLGAGPIDGVMMLLIAASAVALNHVKPEHRDTAAETLRDGIAPAMAAAAEWFDVDRPDDNRRVN